MKWQIVIPYIGPRWNLDQCLKSMGEIPVPLLLVDNSPTSELRDFPDVEYYPENLGVPASWNRGLKRGAQWTMILSCSMRFEMPLKEVMERAESMATPYGMEFGVFGFHATVIGRATVERVGYFDENFYPGYYEDNDYWYRMIVSGMTPAKDWTPRWYDPPLSCIGNAVAVEHMKMKIDEEKLLGYYRRKWGCGLGEVNYLTPFDSGRGLDYWEK